MWKLLKDFFHWKSIVILLCMCQGLCWALGTPKWLKHPIYAVTASLKPECFLFLLLTLALPEGGLFLLEQSRKMCSRWTESCALWLLAQLCHTDSGLHLSKSCFHQVRTKQFLYLPHEITQVVLTLNLEPNAFKFLETRVLGSYFQRNRHNT